MNKDKTICFCENVTIGAIEMAVKNGAKTMEDIKKLTRAGKSCNLCLPVIEKYFRYFIDDEGCSLP